MAAKEMIRASKHLNEKNKVNFICLRSRAVIKVCLSQKASIDKFYQSYNEDHLIQSDEDHAAPPSSCLLMVGATPECLSYMIEKHKVKLSIKDVLQRPPFWYLVNYQMCEPFKEIFRCTWTPQINDMDIFGVNLLQYMVLVGINPLTEELVRAKLPNIGADPSFLIFGCPGERRETVVRPIIKWKLGQISQYFLLLTFNKNAIGLPIKASSEQDSFMMSGITDQTEGMKWQVNFDFKDLTSFEIEYTATSEVNVKLQDGQERVGEFVTAQIEKRVSARILKNFEAEFQPRNDDGPSMQFRSSKVLSNIAEETRGVILSLNIEGNSLILLQTQRGEQQHTKFVCLEKKEFEEDGSRVLQGEKDRCLLAYQNLLKLPRLDMVTEI